jgi:hypothetical protein
MRIVPSPRASAGATGHRSRPIRSVVVLVLASLLAGCVGSGLRSSIPTPDVAPSASPETTATATPAAGSNASPATTGSDLEGDGDSAMSTDDPAGLAVDPSAPIPSGRPPSDRPATPASGEPAAPALERFAIDLYRKGDFVRQFTFDWCVGASLQMMEAMSGGTRDLGRARQERLWEMARDRSFSPFGGANPRGWTAALNDLGVGRYVLVSLPDLDRALRAAALALRATGRPVGLVMWAGRHAWVMSGFESTGDPLRDETFRVTGIRVHDPLHPHGSRVWGRSPAPDELVTPATLGRQFVARTSRRVDLGVGPGYLLVLPTTS